ncbi:MULTISPECIES: VOC family protein [Thalassobaculum]|uniref:Catechol 2,3-dioxygenase n=1 Tax=Thalassobaculum litoreum DSM 18839 TaxID=1123362 RepID=A0A8G2BI78_9PROT|nr:MULTISPECIES: VOC family protein [Thalassobaculum]SDF85611.1 Catechol 2,3-dioxygenase [Thalassobaculum litoreum DSM 18839]
MIDHISIPVSDLLRSAAFWEGVLAPLGLTRLVERERTVGFGKRYPEFWVNLRENLAPAPPDTGAHVCLRAPDRAAVDAFHSAAVALGGRSDGAPGPRQASMTTYYGAFIRDPDGNKVEAVTFPRSERQ